MPPVRGNNINRVMILQTTKKKIEERQQKGGLCRPPFPISYAQNPD
jgi:hypothetical protein